MAQDAWKNFELSGKVTDYLAYRQSGKAMPQTGQEDGAMPMERGMGSYGTKYSSDGNGVECNADWGI